MFNLRCIKCYSACHCWPPMLLKLVAKLLLAFLTSLANLTKVAKLQCCHRNQWQLVSLTLAVNMPQAPQCQGWICNPCQWHPGGRGVNITLNFWKKSPWISWRRWFMDQLEVKNLVPVRFYLKQAQKAVLWFRDILVRILICGSIPLI